MTTVTAFSFGASFFSSALADELQAVSRPATRARARMRFTRVLLCARECAGVVVGFQPAATPLVAVSKPHPNRECKRLLTLHALDVTITFFRRPRRRVDKCTPRKIRRMTITDEDIYLDVETDWGR